MPCLIIAVCSSHSSSASFLFLHFASIALIAPFLLHCKGTGNGSVLLLQCAVPILLLLVSGVIFCFFAGIDGALIFHSQSPMTVYIYQ